MLKVINLKKDFKTNKNTFKILKDIDLDVKKGEFLTIMGPSGAGKTTLLNILSTVDKPTSGKVYYDNQDISKMNNKQLSKFRRDNIGFIFQDYNLLDSMSIEDNIALPLVIANEKQVKIKAEVLRLAKFFGIEAHLKKYPYELSGGQKQRVAAARALITSPKIIFADEPTGALDSKSSKMLLNSIEKLNKELHATILMVTHDAFTASYAHRILFIKDGKIFNELIRGNDSRKEFFNKIIEVVTLLGGDTSNVI